ncbi:hypothetical protein EJ02DRAFT_471267 [Clathrospora elynae]|uniref:Uncharacterized protein n=1 Tax=Clathrospora elynae TaxID=706981 RepID=A0A6A5S5E4_9PLEO|nr:hypothetical protein EJ02DRAFT_471267 [Clathrospora elynae]
MSSLSNANKTQEALNKHEATIEAYKSTLAPFRNFSKPLATDPTPATPRSVGAEELKARIKAARRTKTASQPLPEAVRRKLDRLSDPVHPASHASSGLILLPSPSRSSSHKSRGGRDVSIDAVIRRLQTEADEQSVREHGHSPLSVCSQLPCGPPAFPSLVTYQPRPRTYPPLSSRSSVTKKKSPLSNVSSPDETSRTEASKEGVDDHLIRVIGPRTSMSKLTKRRHEPEPLVSRTSSQRAQNRSSWHSFSRRSILCSV